MKKVFLYVIAISLLASFSMASQEGKGQRIYLKTNKVICGKNSYEMAKLHTQREWEEIYTSGKLNEEMERLCPGANEIRQKDTKYVAKFFYAFASDSGAIIGSC